MTISDALRMCGLITDEEWRNGYRCRGVDPLDASPDVEGSRAVAPATVAATTAITLTLTAIGRAFTAVKTMAAGGGLPPSFSADLRAARKGMGLTQAKLARLAGVTNVTLSNIETGRGPARPQTASKIVRAIENERQRRIAVWRGGKGLPASDAAGSGGDSPSPPPPPLAPTAAAVPIVGGSTSILTGAGG